MSATHTETQAAASPDSASESPASVKLWLDDERFAPPGWRWAKTNAQARDILCSENVIECSLDHNLGYSPPDERLTLEGAPADGSGHDLVRWMIQHNQVPPSVTIHSNNPVEADVMIAALREAGYTATLNPFSISPAFF